MSKVGMSSGDLMSKLVQAKKVMNKVDNGDYQKGNIDESVLLSDPSDLMKAETAQTPPTRPVVNGTVNIDKIIS